MAIFFTDILRGSKLLGGLDLRCRVALAAFRLVAAIALFTGLGASRAVAACGDWLAHSEPAAVAQVTSPQATAASELLNLAGSTPVSRPCSGPSCDKAPMAPVVPVPVQIPTAKDHVCAALALMIPGGIADRESAPFSARDAAPRPGFLRRIDYPPQA